MTRKQWKVRRSLPYIGYTLGNNSFSWDHVECIEEVVIKDLRAMFSVYFVSGEYIEYNYPMYDLTPDYKEEKRLFGRTKKVKITDVQHYFDRNCETLQELRAVRGRVIRAYFEYKRGMRLIKGLK